MPDPRVERLLSVWDDHRAAGEPVPVEDLCRDAPDLLPEVRARIDQVLRFEQLRADTASARSPDDTASYVPTSGDAAHPERLGGYVIRGELGRGGMGVVLRADDPQLGRPVAIKVMLPGLAADAAARARFLREARAVAALRHEHVVPIYHVGEDAGTPYLVMPLLEGETLSERLKRGPLPPAEVARIGFEVAEGLAAAHAKGLIHRDVKPANVWLETPGDRVRLLDFGLARTIDGADGLSRPGAIVGTAAYMSPEQADGLPLDARSDLFSLGAVLYHAATGRPPFEGKTLTAILRAVAEHHPTPACEVNPEISPRLSLIISTMLTKEAPWRPASARSVALDLDIIGRERPLTDEQALLRAIIRSPDDDVPRLVYADYLEKQGRYARAEFIRLQCAWQRSLSEYDQFAYRSRLYNQLQDLIWEHGDNCRSEWKLEFGGGWGDYVRGFIHTARLRGPDVQDGMLAERLGFVPFHVLEFHFSRIKEFEALLADPTLRRTPTLCLCPIEGRDDAWYTHLVRLFIQESLPANLRIVAFRRGFAAAAVTHLADAPEWSFPTLDLTAIADLSDDQQSHLRKRFRDRVLLP